MSGHDHSHCGSCDGDGSHDNTPEMGIEYSLYTKIDLTNMECLNEKVEGSGKTVFKPWEDRLNYEKYVESDLDEELLFNIPQKTVTSYWRSFTLGMHKPFNMGCIKEFTGNIKLKGIVVIGGESDTHPSRLRIFKNRPHMTFDDAGAEPEQEFELHPDDSGTVEYSVKVVKFSSVHHLSLHFPKNFGNESTKIYYIGLRGEYTEAHRHGVTICTYEARPNVTDHKTNILDQVSHEIQ